MTTHLDDMQGLDETISRFASEIEWSVESAEKLHGSEEVNSISVNGDKFNAAQQELKQAILHWVNTELIGEDEVFTDIPVLDVHGQVESVITGDSFTPYMVMRNSLRTKQRAILIHHGYKQNTKEVSNE
jgi:hypothetical protein